jgi:hypothetical protein
LKDIEKYNDAAAVGWRVIRAPWEWIEDGSIVPKVIEALLQEALAEGREA